MRDNTFPRFMQYLALGIFFGFSYSSNSHAFDFTDWDVLIKKYVEPKMVDGVLINSVDYTSLKNDYLFSGLVSRLNSYSLESLKSKNSKLSFWINVYNIFAAQIITNNYPIESIKDAGSIFKSVWNQPAGLVGGKGLTLNIIEHEILREMNEPRIHVAIVCASVSCPDLRLEAYTFEKINDQLDDQMRKFLQSEEKGMMLDRQNKRVYISSIFKWFEEDFEKYGGVLQYIGHFVTEEENKVLSDPMLKIIYLDYNWKINGE